VRARDHRFGSGPAFTSVRMAAVEDRPLGTRCPLSERPAMTSGTMPMPRWMVAVRSTTVIAPVPLAARCRLSRRLADPRPNQPKPSLTAEHDARPPRPYPTAVSLLALSQSSAVAPLSV